MPSYSDGAWRYNVNDIFATNSEKFVSIADTLLAAGWTVVDRSNGAAVSAGGQNNAVDWNNNNAWERYRQPDGQRDMTIQRGLTDRSVRGYFGRAGILFSGGTPTVAPTDATAFQIIGTSGNFNTTFFNSTAANEYCHFAAKTTADGATADVFPLYIQLRTVASPTSDPTSVYLDAVDSPAGTADVEPWVFSTSVATANLGGWYLAGLGGAAQVTAIQRQGIGSTNLGNWNGQNPYLAEDDLTPYFALGTSAPFQRKGRLVNYVGASPIRAAGDTFNLATPGQAKINWITSGSGYALPWPSGVTPLL